MARNTLFYTVAVAGRDHGKTFQITELPATKGEAWAIKVILALIAGGVELPDNFARLGMAGLAEIGLRMLVGLKWEVAEPLLDEMFTTIQFVPDPKKNNIIRPLIEEDIEDISTRVLLRGEWWKLHTDFLEAVAPSLLKKVPAAKKPSSNIKTSRQR